MDTLGLSAAERSAYEAALCAPHPMRMSIQLLDLNHNLIRDLSDMYEDGQTNIDTSQQIRRSATLDLFDPTHAVGLDTKNVDSGSTSPRYMIRARRSIYVADLDKWVSAPLFCGPITRPSRDGDLLKLEMQGKELLACDPLWKPLTIKAGTNKAEAIRLIMKGRAGETRFKLAKTGRKLAHDLSLTRGKIPWDVCRSIAKSLGWALFYDADGYLVGRPASSTPVFTFRTGVGGSIKSDLQVGYAGNDIKNGVYVTGGVPKGKKSPVHGRAFVGGSHPLSPQNLGRNGVSRFLFLEVSDSKILKEHDANELAKKTLPGLLKEQVSITFDSLPIPHLQEFDAISVKDHETGQTVGGKFSQASIPWNSSGSQSNGYLRKVSRSKRVLKGVKR